MNISPDERQTGMSPVPGSQIFDLTMNLHSGFPVWPGDAPGIIEKISSVKKGQSFTSSNIRSSLHWGTHIDAPYHLFEKKWTVDQIPLDVLMGEVQVLEIPRVKRITAAQLEKQAIRPNSRILFKTRNSNFWNNSHSFRRDFTALTPDAAQILVSLNIKMVGIDYFSLDLYDAPELPVHRILYQKNIVGLELLDLRKVVAGSYQLICLPLKIRGGDGAPARVLLIE